LPPTEDRVKEVVDYLFEHGEKETLDTFSLTPETLSRYKRRYKNEMNEPYGPKTILRQLQEKFSEKELEAIVKSANVSNVIYKAPKISFDSELVTFAHITDPHIGSIYFVRDYWNLALEQCRKEGVQFICLTGDVTEGMSNRPGHVYELTHIGYSAQKAYAVECLKQWPGKWYMIDGNHDRWYIKNSGAIIVEEICRELPGAEFLGHDEGDVELNGARIRLWHGEDGSSYATSYRIQKVVEMFTGGEKPQILLAGHTHKQIYMFERNIHCVSGGALSKQSRWMRSKRRPNHMGFHIIRAGINKHGVVRFQPEWYPFFA